MPSCYSRNVKRLSNHLKHVHHTTPKEQRKWLQIAKQVSKVAYASNYAMTNSMFQKGSISATRVHKVNPPKVRFIMMKCLVYYAMTNSMFQKGSIATTDKINPPKVR